MCRCLHFTEKELAERMKTDGMSGIPAPRNFSTCSVCGATMQVDEHGNAYCPVCDDVSDHLR